MTRRVIGMDPSLTSFGVSNGDESIAIKSEASVDRSGRIRTLIAEVVAFCTVTRFNDNGIPQLWAVEAPMLHVPSHGGSHLYELGWLMSRLHDAAVAFGASLIEVPTSEVRRYATGKANAPKDEMKLRVFKKWGVEFEKDPGCDKLFAYALYRYGEALLAGEVTHTPPKPRGKGKAVVARAKRAKAVA